MDVVKKAVETPIAVFALMVFVLISGITAISKLPIQLLPDVDYPEISISTFWSVAAPEEVEANIIEPQEDVLRHITGVNNMTSNINRGAGSITLSFEPGYDMDKAMIQTINRLNQSSPLPRDSVPPSVSVSSSQESVATLFIHGIKGHDIVDFSRFQPLFDTKVQGRLKQIKGVSNVRLMSKLPLELQIILDPVKMASLEIQLEQVAETLYNRVDLSAGDQDVGRRSYTVRFSNNYDPQAMGDLVVAQYNERPVLLKDIATVKITPTETKGLTIRNGTPAYYITMSKTIAGNTVDILEQLSVVLTELNSEVLEKHNLKMVISFDSSIHIKRAVELVKSGLGLGLLLAVAILLFFLPNRSAGLIVISVIPISLTISLLVLSLLDRSLNVISLAGLALAVGLVLDAAIVVQDNIIAWRAKGYSYAKTIIMATSEVKGALFASTTTTVIIFLPVIYTDGVVGQLFKDLALTIAVAVVGSFIGAITLIPAINASLKKLTDNKEKKDKFEALWQVMAKIVTKVQPNTISQTAWAITLIIGSAAAGFYLTPKVDFLPATKVDAVFSGFSLPPGASLETLQQDIAEPIVKRLKPMLEKTKEPYITGYNLNIYGPFNSLYLYPEDPKKVGELIETLQSETLIGLPDTQVYTAQDSLLNVSFDDGRTVNIDISGTKLSELSAVSKRIQSKLDEHLPNAPVWTTPSGALQQPELQVIPNEKRISEVGLRNADVGDVVRAATDGYNIGEYFDGNLRYDVYLKSHEWQSPEDLAAIPIYTPQAGIQLLSSLASINRTVGPTELLRINGKRSLSINVITPDGMSVQEVLDTINQEVIPEVEAQTTESVQIGLRGSSDKLKSTIKVMKENFAVAILMLALMLLVLFRSLRDTLLTLLSLPLALFGGVLALTLLNIISYQSLDLITMIGFIILLGLVINNSILIVMKTRQGQKEGYNVFESIEQAVSSRVRAVFLSTTTTIIGLLPLLLFSGAGSEIYRGLAAVIIGGMSMSLLFTLILMSALLHLDSKFFPSKKQSNNTNKECSKLAA